MGFYDDLTKTPTPPKKKTPVQKIEEDYQNNLDYLFKSILHECTCLKQSGKRQFEAYSYIKYEEDTENVWMRWISGYSPKENLDQIVQRWTRIKENLKGSAPPEIRDNKDQLFRFAADRCFPEQSKLLRDRLLNELKIKLLDEGFPVGCITPIDLPIVLPTSYSFFSGKLTGFEHIHTCYYMKVSITW